VTYTDEEGYLPTLIDGQLVVLQPSSTYIGAFLGLDWAWTISDNTSLVERLVFLPNIDESSDWRYRTDTGLQVQMSERLALRVGYQIRYDNEPAPGFDDTDSALKISLVVGL
jgi:putative salt-induced outer membrane protein